VLVVISMVCLGLGARVMQMFVSVPQHVHATMLMAQRLDAMLRQSGMKSHQ